MILSTVVLEFSNYDSKIYTPYIGFKTRQTTWPTQPFIPPGVVYGTFFFKVCAHQSESHSHIEHEHAVNRFLLVFFSHVLSAVFTFKSRLFNSFTVLLVSPSHV